MLKTCSALSKTDECESDNVLVHWWLYVTAGRKSNVRCVALKDTFSIVLENNVNPALIQT